MAEECKSLDGKREHCGCNLTRCHWCGVELHQGKPRAHPDTMIGRR